MLQGWTVHYDVSHETNTITPQPKQLNVWKEGESPGRTAQSPAGS